MASCAFVPTVAAGALVARSAAATSSRRPAAVPSARGVQMLMGGGKGNEAGGGKNPFGALGNMGNIMDAVKKAQQFTESAKELQDELKEVCHLPALVFWLCAFVGRVLPTALRWSATSPCSSVGFHWSTHCQRLDQHVLWVLFFSSLPHTIPLDPRDLVDRGSV